MEKKVKTKSPLSGLWLIGAIHYDRDGIGTARLARTKTEARQRAERTIAGAVYHWHRSGARSVQSSYEHHQKYLKKPEYSLDDFMRDMQTGRLKGSCSYDVKLYYIMRDGIWLTSPGGERFHITEVKEKYLEQFARNDRQKERDMKALVAGVKASAREHADRLSKREAG